MCPFWGDDFLTHAVRCIFVVFYFETKNRGLARKPTSSKALNNLSLTLMHSPTLPIPFIRSIFTSSTRSSGSARTMIAWAEKWFKPSHQYLLTLRLGFYRDYNSFCTTVEPPYNEHLNNQPSPEAFSLDSVSARGLRESGRISLGDVTVHGRVQEWPSRLGTRLLNNNVLCTTNDIFRSTYSKIYGRELWYNETLL